MTSSRLTQSRGGNIFFKSHGRSLPNLIEHLSSTEHFKSSIQPLKLLFLNGTCGELICCILRKSVNHMIFSILLIHSHKILRNIFGGWLKAGTSKIGLPQLNHLYCYIFSSNRLNDIFSTRSIYIKCPLDRKRRTRINILPHSHPTGDIEFQNLFQLRFIMNPSA